MKLFINGIAATAGGGLTYLRNVVPELSRREDCECVLAVSAPLRDEFRGMNRVNIVDASIPQSTVRRVWWEQSAMAQLIRQSAADVLLSAGNFAIRASPVPQILLSRNSLYTSSDFYCDLCERGEYRLWLGTKFRGELARRSILWADCTVAPSQAFANELEKWTGKSVLSLPHGFDRSTFTAGSRELEESTQEKIDLTGNSFRLLFVSHYNYYRNFETLFRALALLNTRKLPRDMKLMLTCSLRGEDTPGGYRPESAARLIRELNIAGQIIELGAIPYDALHLVYESANAYVSAAYAESFAHPLNEAMSSGLPVIASDIPVHREICGDAALYFPRFSPERLADAIEKLATHEQLANEQGRLGVLQSQRFSWSDHVDELLKVSDKLLSARSKIKSAERPRSKAAAAN